MNLRRPNELNGESRDPKPSFTDNLKSISTLQSRTLRHDQAINKDIPGPGSYLSIDQKENKSVFKKEVQNFGTLVQRDLSYLRNPTKQAPNFKFSPNPSSQMKPRSIE